ncbi:hypothetical protein QTP88_013720 [Uroleucon formosanum]
MDNKRKRSIFDDGENQIRKMPKTSNATIDYSLDADTEESKSQALCESTNNRHHTCMSIYLATISDESSLEESSSLVEDQNIILKKDPVKVQTFSANSLSECTNNRSFDCMSAITISDDSFMLDSTSLVEDRNVICYEDPVTQQIFSANSLGEYTINRHHGKSSVSENLTMETRRSLHNCPTEVPTSFLTVPVQNVGCHANMEKVMAWNCDPTSSISYDWNMMDTELSKKESESVQFWTSCDDKDNWPHPPYTLLLNEEGRPPSLHMLRNTPYCETHLN